MKKSTSKSKSALAVSKSAAKNQAKNSVFDVELVQSFFEFMKSQDVVELDLEEGDRKIRLRRASAGTPMMMAAPMAQVAAPAATPAMAAAAAPVAEAPRKAASPKYHVVTSPFVGTFYRSAGPNQDSFVEEGKAVNVGQTLCIVEAMKLMNEIESDVKGRIVSVLVKNATPVEFGEPLFEIDPS